MAVLKTRWKAPLSEKEEAKKIPEKKVVIKEQPVIEEAIVKKVIDDPTAEEFIATLPKKQRGSKKVIKIIEE